MDLKDLVNFIAACNRYKKRIDYIEIDNTSNVVQYFDNFYFKAVLNIPYYVVPILFKDDEFDIKRINRYARIMKVRNIISSELHGYSEYIKVECANELENIYYVDIILDNLKRYCKVENIKCYYKGEEIDSSFIWQTREIIENKIRAKLREQALKGLIKDESFIDEIRSKLFNEHNIPFKVSKKLKNDNTNINKQTVKKFKQKQNTSNNNLTQEELKFLLNE